MKSILIVGAGPGISYSVAKRFGREGFRVGLVARNAQKLSRLCDQLADAGIDARYETADVTEADSLKHAVDNLRGELGEPEVYLYNPSGFSQKEILDQDWDTIRWAIDVSAGGLFHLFKLILPGCLERNRGKLLVTGGGTGLKGVADMVALSAGKATMRNLVQAFQQRVKDTPIHIAQVTVCGYVHPSDPKYAPDTIADIYWRLYEQQPGAYEEEVIY